MTPSETLTRPARIETARLVLVVLLPSEIRALMTGDWARASSEAGVVFPEGWPQSDAVRSGLPRHLRVLESDERHRAWRIRVVVDRDTNAVVGSVNMQGSPNADGDVEIGWGIGDAWRRRGYAHEAASGVTAWALAQPGTKSLTALIADNNVASQQLARKLGFVRTAQLRRDTPVWCRVAGPTLRRLTGEDEEEFLCAHRATTPSVPNFLHHYTEGMAFGRYLELLAEHESGINLPSPNHVPSTFLFAFVGARIVGRVSIRHSLTEFLEREGGHIGYVVVPEFRRRGYATAMLRSALQIARESCGLDRLLVTCDDDNVASIRTIEKNAGVLANIVSRPDREKPVRRYWIDLDKKQPE